MSTEERRVQLVTEVDTTGARAGFEEVSQQAGQMAGNVTRAGERAERAVNGVGSGAGRSAQRVQTAERSIVNSIQRTTAQMESGSRTSAQYYEVLARQRGVNPNVLRPYLDQLRAVELAQQRAAQTAGQSAGQIRSAMAQVPAQMTDILVSLQGGQNALTVALQQGGQLRDSFGGIVPAARALGGQLMALVNPYTVAAAGAAALTYAYVKGSAEARAYNLAIATTGNIAGTSSGQLADAAAYVAEFTGSQREAAQVLASMTATGRIAGSTMAEIAVVAIKAQRDLGREVGITISEFEAIGKSPVDALRELSERYRHITAATLAQVKALYDQGRATEAATLAQQAHAEGIERSRQRVVDGLSDWERGWQKIKKEIGEATDGVIDWFLNVSREDGSFKAINELLEKRARIEENIANAKKNNDSWGLERQTKLLKQNEAEINAEREKARVKKESADAEARSNEATELRNRLLVEADKLLSRQEQRDKAIERGEAQAKRLGLSAEETKTHLALIRKEYSDLDEAAKRKQEEASKKVADQLKKEAAAMAEMAGLTTSFADDWKLLSDMYAKGAISLAQLEKEQSNLLAKQPAIKAAADQQKKALEEQEKLVQQGIDSATAQRDSLLEQLTAQRSANDEIGLSAEALAELQVRRLEDAAASKEQTAAALESIEPGSLVAQRYREQAEALRDLADAKREGARKQIGADSAKAAVEDWKRASESINQSLTDALLRGFESGKGFGENLADTLKNMFSTLVLRPVVSAVVNPMAGAVTGALGLSGPAGAATSAAASGLGSAVGTGLGIGGAMSAIGTGAVQTAGALLTGQIGFGTTLGAGLSAIGTGTMSGISAGLSSVVGVLGPIALGLGAAVAIWKKMDSSGTYHTGGAAMSSSSRTSTVSAQSLNMANIRSSADTQKFVEGLTQGIVGILDSTALAFGKTAGYTAATAFADDSSKDGAWGSLVIQKLGQDIIDWQDTRNGRKWAPKTFADGEKGQAEYLAALTGSVRDALNSIGLPDWARTMLNGVASDASLENLAQVVEQINVTQAALAAMRSQLVGFKDLSDTTVSALMAASGGIDKLFGNASAYYDAFYTEAEKNAVVSDQVAKALAAVNLQMPTTREGYRALLEAQMKLGPAGAEAVAVLFNAAAAFAQITPVVEAVKEAAKDLTPYRNALTEAYNAESDAIQGTVNRMGSFAASLRELGKSALLGNLSPLSPQQKYVEAKAQYEAVLAAARGGDEEAQGRYSEVYTAFLEASRSVFASSGQYTRDFDYAQAATAEAARWAEAEVDVGKQQLTLLRSQVSGLIDVNKSVLSVREAIYQLHQAEGKAPVGPQMPAPAFYVSPAVYGAPNTEPLVAEIKALRQEVSTLRAEQARQTGDMIRANAQASRESAADIAGATTTAVKSAAYREERVYPE